VAGFLTLLGPANEVEEIDEQLLTRAAPAFAVPVAKHRAVMETQTRLQGGFLENLLGGTFADEEDIVARAQYLGHNLREPYDTACLMLDDPADRRLTSDEAQRLGLWTSFLDLAHREILARWPRALLRERGDVLAVLIPVSEPDAANQFAGEFEALRGRLDTLVASATTTIGLGRRATGPRAVVRSYAEAEQAARIGRQFLGGHQTIAFDDLGVYRVIARVEDREALTTFRREYLGAIEDYDARHSAELVETLEGFFRCNGNHARAAEMLHLHRNTLLYRLERIEALTGRDLSDAETRLSMQLALKIRRVADTLRVNPVRSFGGRTQ
jgi:purine catabolism regulator